MRSQLNKKMKKLHQTTIAAVLCILLLLVNTGCKGKKSPPVDSSVETSDSTPQEKPRLTKTEILKLNHEISEIVKDIEYQERIKYPDSFYYFRSNSTFNKLAQQLVDSTYGDYANSDSDFIRKEYSRVQSAISADPASILEVSVSRSSVHDDRKGSGSKFTVSSTSQTFLPLSFEITGAIIPHYLDESSPWNDGEYDRRGTGDALKTGLTFDKRFYTWNSDYIYIWDRARGEKISGQEFTDECNKLYHGQNVGRALLRTWKRVSRGWELQYIQPTSVKIEHRKQ